MTGLPHLAALAIVVVAITGFFVALIVLFFGIYFAVDPDTYAGWRSATRRGPARGGHVHAASDR